MGIVTTLFYEIVCDQCGYRSGPKRQVSMPIEGHMLPGGWLLSPTGHIYCGYTCAELAGEAIPCTP